MTATPAPLDTEIATRSQAVIDAALAALRSRPPARCARCGMRGAFTPDRSTPGWWRCGTCHGGTFRALPTPAEEAEARTSAARAATDAVVEAARVRVAELREADTVAVRPAGCVGV